MSAPGGSAPVTGVLARLALSAALAIAAAGPRAAPAQEFAPYRSYDPAFSWRTLETAHFQVHFHQGLDGLAQDVARFAEEAHARLVPILGWAPRQRTQIVVSDDRDEANGSATPVPYDLIRIYAVPPSSLSQLNDEHDWLRSLVTHEYVHVLHLDHVEGGPALVDVILGKVWVPNGLLPSWYIEGLAVTHESSEDPTTGRNASALFEAYARAMALEPPGLPSLAEISNPYLDWPAGDVPYLLGGRFVDWLEGRYGEGPLRQVIADQAGAIWPWAPSGATERRLGADLPALWDRFRGVLRARAEAEIAAVRARPVTRPRRLTWRGGLVLRPRWTPDGRTIVYLDRGLDERPALRRVTPAGVDLGPVLPADVDGSFDVRSAREAVVALGQIWHEFRLYADLWLVDLDTGAARQLTDGERATDPAVTPDGRSVVYVAHVGGGRMALRRRPIDGGDAVTLLERPGLEIYEPAVAPDGRRIALSIQEGGRRDLAIWEGGDLRRVTDDAAIDLAPSWSADGRWLLFSSDRSGVYDVYAFEPATGRLRQVTNVETGAFDPALSPDGRTLAFSTYSRIGHDLATVPFDPATWLEPPAPPPAGVPPAPAPASPALPARPYAALETLRPYQWLPIAGLDAAGTTLGAYTIGGDAVGLHTWAAQGFWSLGGRTPGYAASYVGGWSWPALDLLSERYVDASPGEPARLLADWTPLAGGLTFTFTRVERAAALRLGWSTTRYDSLAAPPQGGGYAPGVAFRDGLLSEATLGFAYDDAFRYERSISPEEGGSFTLRARWAGPATGSDYDLWRARAAAVRYLRIPGTRHAVLALRLSGALARGTLGGAPPFALGGLAAPDALSLLQLQAFSASDQLRGYPASVLPGYGTALASLELRFPLWTPDLGRSTWPLFLRRIHGALFADGGQAFGIAGEPGPILPGYRWDRVRVGVGGELRLETAFAYWLLADVRFGIARGIGEPLGGLGPAADPLAQWQFYATVGPSF